MINKKTLIIAVVGILIIVLGIFLAKKAPMPEVVVMTIEGEAIDTAMDFYDEWLTALSSNNSPYTTGLTESEYLTATMREKLMSAQASFAAGTADPVMCKVGGPTGIRSKIVSEQETSAQVLILGSRKDAQAIALVKLIGEDGRWKISDINCNAGETAPEVGEFNFEREGYLLKHSVKPPLDSNNWYLVYESEGVMGYTAILNFNETSLCTKFDGTAVSCDDNSLYEVMKVKVSGNVTEAGVDVAKVAEIE